MDRTVYYLPGNGGRIDTGLGQGLAQRGFHVAGRMTVGEFRSLRLGEQSRIIAQDLVQHFWRPDAHVVANSYGGYLFLQAQALLQPFPGKVLLLSPIVGEAVDPERGTHFLPPCVDQLHAQIEAGDYEAPERCEIHVGEHDWQSNPTSVTALGQRLGIPVTVVPGAGHMLGVEYVGGVLDRWLA